MVSMMPQFMSIESSRSYIDDLYSNDMDKCLYGLTCLKNAVIGSNRQKSAMIEQGVVRRLIELLNDPSSSLPIRINTVVTIGSLAKGTEDNIQALVNSNVIPPLLHGLLDNDSKLVEYTLCALKSIFCSPRTPSDVLYCSENVPYLLLKLLPQSVSNQVAVTHILAATCKTVERQNMLCKQGAVSTLAALLCSPHHKVQLPTLSCLANLAYDNGWAADNLLSTSYNGKRLPELVVPLTGRSRTGDVQLAAAKVLVNLQRADGLTTKDPRILYRALPCLVRLIKDDRPVEQRVEAAETLAYLTEVDTGLQRLASISNHLIPTLALLLRGQPNSPDQKVSENMKQAAFRAFASLGANDEEIRKKIIDTDNFMMRLMTGLEEPCPVVQLAAVRCLHSLSRSVHQLRTTFQDCRVWEPLMPMLTQDDVILKVASSTLCNLLLEFSPSKEPIVESGAIPLIVDLTKRPDPCLRLNGIWALMNMAFQAELPLKHTILASLGMDQIYRLLSDSQSSVVMKTLGLLRNLLSTSTHIDNIMNMHPVEIMQDVELMLDSNHAPDVKEQALCILANIAGGGSAKELIMASDEILKRISDYMLHEDSKLQTAAVYCVSNLVWRGDSGAVDRQFRLKDMGFVKILQQLMVTRDTTLFEKVKTAMTQFEG